MEALEEGAAMSITPENGGIRITREGDLVKLTLNSDITTAVAWSLAWKK